MYKLLIVDDEPLVLVGIKSMIDYSKLNIEIIGTASNGQAALEIMSKDMPDIVLTDIKMPVMDGLQFLREVRKLYGETNPVVVMLTSYEDFHMAKEALCYHAFDYLVKVELTDVSLTDELKRVIKHIEKHNKSLQNAVMNQNSTSGSEHSILDKFMISLLNNLFESEEQFLLQASELGLSFDYSSYVCCYGELASQNASDMELSKQFSLYSSSLNMMSDLLNKYIPVRLLALDTKHYALILCFNETLNTESKGFIDLVDIINNVIQSIDNYYNVKVTCGIGVPVSSPMSICDSYQYSRQAFRKADDNSKVVLSTLNKISEAHDIFNIALFRKDLTKAFEEYDSELLLNTLNSLCDLLSNNRQHFIQALDLASNLLYLSISLLQDSKNTLSEYYKDSPDSYLSLYRLNNVDQIIEWLNYFGKCICDIFETHRKDYKNRIVTDVKKYISEHVKEKLLLNEVAAIFGISPSYLSQLFGKYNETGFSEYINICKINAAKIMLKENNMKVYEVADELSFGSEFYFSKVFKKVEGITPSEFLSK